MIEKLIGFSSLKVVTILDSNGITRSFEPTESNLQTIKINYPDLYNNINQIWDKQVFNDYKNTQKAIADNDPLPTTGITNGKSNEELEQELIATQSILGDTILSSFETLNQVDYMGAILGDTIMLSFEMQNEIDQIKEKLEDKE